MKSRNSSTASFTLYLSATSVRQTSNIILKHAQFKTLKSLSRFLDMTTTDWVYHLSSTRDHWRLWPEFCHDSFAYSERHLSIFIVFWLWRLLQSKLQEGSVLSPICLMNASFAFVRFPWPVASPYHQMLSWSFWPSHSLLIITMMPRTTGVFSLAGPSMLLKLVLLDRHSIHTDKYLSFNVILKGNKRSSW